jgi:hypothetical protein
VARSLAGQIRESGDPSNPQEGAIR